MTNNIYTALIVTAYKESNTPEENEKAHYNTFKALSEHNPIHVIGKYKGRSIESILMPYSTQACNKASQLNLPDKGFYLTKNDHCIDAKHHTFLGKLTENKPIMAIHKGDYYNINGQYYNIIR